MPKGPFKQLKVAMFAKDVTWAIMCEEVGIGWTTLGSRLNGSITWELKEVYAVCDLLEIPYEEIPIYFPRSDLKENKISLRR